MDNGSTFRVLSADVAPVHGLNPNFVCYDELGQAPNRELYDALSTALGGRAQPLMLVISTQAASDIAPMSELIDYGLRIERGEIKDAGFHLDAVHRAARIGSVETCDLETGQSGARRFPIARRREAVGAVRRSACRLRR